MIHPMRACARPTRVRRAVTACVALALALVPLTRAHAAGPGALDTKRFIPLAEVHAGQHATCRTVFAGRAIEDFDLEVVGVVKGGKADGDMILARATQPRLVHDGIAAGMSGSPVYIDGRLAGALAFGWPFSRDPLCGITPIADMLDVMQEPDGAPAGDFDAHSGPALAPSRGETGGLERLRTPLVCGGLTPAARAQLAPWAEQNGFVLEAGGVGGVPGGGYARVGDAATRASLVPGAAISVDLMRGDMNLAAIGTLTWRDGDRVAAFGHPFFQAGNVAMPLATADIATIVASDLNSFKMGTPGEQVGAITQDRRAAVAGSIGAVPSMLPFTIRLHAAEGDDTYHLWILRHRQFAPLLASTGVTAALTARGGAMTEATYRWRATLALKNAAPVTIEDVTSGNVEGAGALVSSFLSLLLDNPFAPVDADSITLDLDVRPGNTRTQIVSATVEPRVVKPGDAATVTAELRDWRGRTHYEQFQLPIPLNQPDGRMAVAIGGGPEVDRQEAARLPGRYRAVSLADLEDRVRQRRRDDHLYAALYAAGVEGTALGEPHPDLPVFAQRLMASDRANRPNEALGSLVRVAQASRPMGEPVDGVLAVPIDVRALAVPNGLAQPPGSRTIQFRLATPDPKEDE